jgi:hypothetical protein
MVAVQVARRACRFLAIGFAIGLAACAGPRPVVERVDVRAGVTYDVRVTVVNQAGGSGQVDLTARLVDSATGRTGAQAARNIALEAHERVDVVLSLTPASAGTYRAVVEVHYPEE